MLSGFSSYFFGGNAEERRSQTVMDDDATNVTAVLSESNDWVLLENPDKEDVGIDVVSDSQPVAVSIDYDNQPVPDPHHQSVYQPVPVSIDYDDQPVPDPRRQSVYRPVPVSIDYDDQPVADPSHSCSYQLVPVPASDCSDSPPGSMSSTPAKSIDAGGMSASISAGSSDEPSSDFECFRGPYLSTRELLDDRPIGSETGGALSDVSSQPEQLSHPSMEECWLVTPPPCFVTGNTPHDAVAPTSPLEDLLIEHPSMSVYHPRLGRQLLMDSSASSGADFSPSRIHQSFPMSASADAFLRQPLAADLPLPDPLEMPPPGPQIIPRRATRLNHILNNVAATTVYPSSWNGMASKLRGDNARNFLDRKNRIRAVVGHGHGYRRSQRMTVIHSGMNNSRHCQ